MGYTSKTYHAIERADIRMLGVQLGAVCVDANIPVQVVARWLKVTRQAVYYWFTGTTEVAIKHRERVAHIVKVLNAALDANDLPAANIETALEVIKRYRAVIK